MNDRFWAFLVIVIVVVGFGAWFAFIENNRQDKIDVDRLNENLQSHSGETECEIIDDVVSKRGKISLMECDWKNGIKTRCIQEHWAGGGLSCKISGDL